MGGKYIVIPLLLFAVFFGAILFYFQEYAFYEKIYGIKSVKVSNKVISVSNYIGIDSETSGLKLRGCFDVDVSDFNNFDIYDGATPLKAPFWFECFDYKELQIALNEKLASAFLAEVNEKDGIDRVIAVFADGKAYQWRQLNAKYVD